MWMGHTIKRNSVSVVLSNILVLLHLSTVSGSWEKRTFPLPALPEVTYHIDDVILRPTKSTSLTLNVTLIDLATNVTLCELSVTEETDPQGTFYNVAKPSSSYNITGLALITSVEAVASINISGNEVPLLPIYNMGEKFIIPEDLDSHETDHINSLLIYTSAKNTSVSICFDQKFGGHLTGQFADRLDKWIDGLLQCYRKNLRRCEIWMINNASVHRGLEIIADNPIGVVRWHSTNSSFGHTNGRFIDGMWNQGTNVVWIWYPPLKFWGKQFILFPSNEHGQQNITVVAEEDTNVTLVSTTKTWIISIPGRQLLNLVIEPTKWVTLYSSSEIIVSSILCKVKPPQRILYHTSLDNAARIQQNTNEHYDGLKVVCLSPSDIFSRLSRVGMNVSETENVQIGNKTVFCASIYNNELIDLDNLNISDSDCFLTRTIDSKICLKGMNTPDPGRETDKNSSVSVPINDSHLTNVSVGEMIDRKSEVVIEVHKNDNVNRSSNGNSSDVSLKGNKSEFVHNRSKEQIASNRTWFSNLFTMKTTVLPVRHQPLLTLSKGQTDKLTSPYSTRTNMLPSTTESAHNKQYLYNQTMSYKQSTDKSVTRASSSVYVNSTEDGTQLPFNQSTVITDGPVLPKTNITKVYAANKYEPNIKQTIESGQRQSEVKKNSYSETTNNTRQIISKLKKALNEATNNDTLSTHSFGHSQHSRNDKNDIYESSNSSKILLSTENKNMNDSKNPDSSPFITAPTTGKISNATDLTTQRSNKTKTYDKSSNDRFKVVVDILSSGKKHININPRVRYEHKNPTYVNIGDDGGKLEQVGDGKSLVAVIVSLSSALFAVIAIILVFFFIEYFSRRKQLRKTRIRPFLSDY